jgi:hypothetical protein
MLLLTTDLPTYTSYAGMNRNDIFRKIGVIISELNEQYEYLSNNPESLHDLELELFSANADFLSEHVKVLKRLYPAQAPISAPTEERHSVPPEPAAEQVNTKIEVAEAPPAETPVGDTEPEASGIPDAEAAGEHVPEFGVQDTAAPASDATPAEAAEEPGEPSAEPAEIVPAAQQEETKSSPEPVEEAAVPEEKPAQAAPDPVSENSSVSSFSKEVVIPAKEVYVEPKTLQEKPAQTINDLISAQRQASQSVTGQFAGQPVKDLKSAISLNDKMMFTRDLFNGYSLAYSEAIELLNRFDSFEAADNFLKTNYEAKNNWTAKTDTDEKFYELLRRRFAK